jgi:hypothetical protein
MVACEINTTMEHFYPMLTSTSKAQILASNLNSNHQISIDIRFRSYIPKPICGLLHLNGKKLVAHVGDHYIPKLNLMVLTCKNLITNPLTYNIVTTQNVYGARKKQWIIKIL